MNYTLIRLDHLDKTNATKIEANLDAVTYAELEHAKDTGTRAAAVTRDLHRGELFLIAEAPRVPLFTKKNGALSLVDPHAVSLPQEAIQKASQRVIPPKHTLTGTGTTPSGENLLPADESTTKTLEDIPAPQRNKHTPHYHNLEIACPASSVKTYAPGIFNLGGTDTEPKKALELKNAASDNAWYSVECTCDEAKRLFYKPNGSADSNLVVQSVSLSTTCDVSAAKEAYIPVTPAVQVNERLGFPTTGYFYHFHGNVLIHEYKIDEGKCTFSITHSRTGVIIDGTKFPKSQHSILLFWRTNGKVVNNQYLLYKKEQLTTTDLQKIAEEWLQENGFAVDVNALLAARSEPIAQSVVEDLPAEAPKKVHRYGNILYKCQQPELAPSILPAKKGGQPFDIAVCNVAKHCPHCGKIGECRIKIDYDFIAEREGKLRIHGYVPDLDNSQSGVTISSGVDLGCRNLRDLINLGLSQELINELSPYLLKKKHEALAFLKKHPLTISKEEAFELYVKVKKDTTELLIRTYDIDTTGLKFRCLPQEAQTVIASVFYQYQNKVLRYNFWKHVCKQDWQATYSELMDFKDRYPTRRKLEAKLLTRLL